MILRNSLFLVLFASLLSCGQENSAEQQNNPLDNAAKQLPSEEKQPSPPPAKRADTIMIEGMKEPIELSLYRAPQSWPLPFYTYLPPDIKTETISSGEGDAIVFQLNEASLRYFIFPDNTDRSEAQKRAQLALGTRAVQSCEQRYDWQWGCFMASDQPDKVIKVYIGENNGRYFYFLVNYPAEYGDGFSPRYHLILDEWQWE